jgi:hypothetical protein
MPCVTLLGVASIQDFVFRSNRLRENLGASGLVRYAMQWWNRPPRNGLPVIYVGGGNAALRFSDIASARKAIGLWSNEMLREAPGLRLSVTHQQYSRNQLAQAFRDAQRQLVEEENRPPLGSELGALPIVRACPSTGMAASEKAAPIRDPDSEDDVEDTEPDDDLDSSTWLSAEAQAKRKHFWEKVRRDSAGRYSAALKTEERRYRFPRELDLLGTVEGSSQIALVHADGNSIGSLLDQVVDEHQNRTDDERFVAALSSLSRNITTLAEDAFKLLIKELVAKIPEYEQSEIISLKKTRDGGCYFPMRPIVHDGDDLTFVCHGRLGLSLAARYLRLFEQEASKALNRRFTACAGVLVMPKKFPFAQGYNMAEELCAGAKRTRRESRSLDAREAAWLDFHVQMEGRAGNVELTRARQYPKWGTEPVLRRPYCLGSGSPRWADFETLWSEFQCWPRSVAKRLYQTYSSGQGDVEGLLKRMGSYKERPLKLPGDLSGRDAFDALEFLDFHVCWPKIAAGD